MLWSIILMNVSPAFHKTLCNYFWYVSDFFLSFFLSFCLKPHHAAYSSKILRQTSRFLILAYNFLHLNIVRVMDMMGFIPVNGCLM